MAIEWPLVVFTTLTGCGGWVAACIAVSMLAGGARVETAGSGGNPLGGARVDWARGNFAASVAAIVLLGVGGCASVLHLQHPDKILNALAHPTSGIFVEAVLVGLCALAVLVFAVMLKRESPLAVQRAVAAVAGVLGVALAFMAGHSYMMASIPAWNTYLLPLAYLLTAAPAGIAVYLAVINTSYVSADDAAPVDLAPGTAPSTRPSSEGLSEETSATEDVSSAPHASSEGLSKETSATEDASSIPRASSGRLAEAVSATEDATGDAGETALGSPLFQKLLFAAGVASALGVLAYSVSTGQSGVVAVMWVCALVVGGVVPAVCAYTACRKSAQGKGLVLCALVCALAGSVLFRCLMWVAGVATVNFFGGM